MSYHKTYDRERYIEERIRDNLARTRKRDHERALREEQRQARLFTLSEIEGQGDLFDNPDRRHDA